MAVAKISTLAFIGFLSAVFGVLLLVIGLPEDHVFEKSIPVRVTQAEVVVTKESTARYAFRACWEWSTEDSIAKYCGNPHPGNVRVKYRQTAEELRQEILKIETGGFCKGINRPVLFEEKMDPFERKIYVAAPYLLLTISFFMFGRIFLMALIAWKISKKEKRSISP